MASQNQILIDSNILIYALNADSPKSDLALAFLLQLKNSVIAEQNILETLRVMTHPTFGLQLETENILDTISEILPDVHIIRPNDSTYKFFLTLLDSVPVSGNHIFDTYLVATMLSHRITSIATDNVKDFKIYSHIQVNNPFM